MCGIAADNLQNMLSVDSLKALILIFFLLKLKYVLQLLVYDVFKNPSSHVFISWLEALDLGWISDQICYQLSS